MLQTLQFRIGTPTANEFLEAIFEELTELKMLPTSSDNFKKLCLYLAKAAAHNYQLSQLPASVLASAVMRVAFRFYEKVERSEDVPMIMQKVLRVAGVSDEESYKNACKDLIAFARNFEKTYPKLNNLRNQNADILPLIKGKEE